MRLIRFYFLAIGASMMLLNACSDKSANTDNTTENADSAQGPAFIHALNAQIEQDPSNAALYHERAVKLYDSAYFKQAYADAKKAAELAPDNAEYLFSLGQAAFEVNEVAEAVSTLNNAVGKDPKMAKAWLKLAKIQFYLKRYDDSKRSLEACTKENGELAEAYFIQALIKRDITDTASSIANLQKAVSLNDSYFDAYMMLGLLLTAQQNELAIDYLNNAVRLDDSSVLALYTRAQALQEFGLKKKNKEMIKNAAADYNRIIEINPNHAPSYYNLGMINFRLDQFENAVAHFNEAIIADENYVDAYYMRGLSHQGIGNLSEAKANYEATLQLDPNYTIAREMLELLGSR
ncbi:MAG: tetratricopeptide repeat protein [Bacteroidetes bacterium]|nr:MAG: tetratricopeptide repeat protein [Bacteroidota bacterium]